MGMSLIDFGKIKSYIKKTLTSQGALVGPKGDKGDVGPQGPIPIKGTDYFTEEDIGDMIDTIIEQLPVNTALLARLEGG